VTRTGTLSCRFEWPSFCPVFENIPEMLFVPWAWTSFPVEPENGIVGLAIRGRIGRIWDTVFWGLGKDSLIHGKDDPVIRAIFGPGLPLRTPLFRNFVPKWVQFYTLF